MENVSNAWKWLVKEIGRGSWVAGVLVILAGALVYANTLNASWHFDDYQNIVDNPYVHDWKWFKDHTGWNKGRVVGDLTFLINYRTDGDRVMGYHLVNITIHVLAALVVWRLVAEMWKLQKEGKGILRLSGASHSTRSARGDKAALKSLAALSSEGGNWVGLIAALMFVVHPVQTQAVTYIVQRFASLAGLFYLMAVWAYVKARRAKIREVSWWGWWGVVVVAGGLGLLTKETLLSLPVMLLLIEGLWFSRGWRDWLMKAAGLGLVGVVGVGLVVAEMGFSYIFMAKETGMRETVTWGSYLLTQTRVVWKYIQLLVVPLGQNLDYTFPLSYGLGDPRVIFGLVGLVGLVGLAGWWWKRWRWGSMAVGWFLVGLSVTSLVPIQDVIFDHRLYVSAVAWAMLVAGWLYKKWGKDKVVLVLLSVLVVGAYGWWGHTRNRVWASEISLWQDVVRKSPNKVRGLNQYAVHLQKAGRVAEAVGYYQKVVELEPDNADVYYNLGQAMVTLNKPDEAIAMFSKSAELNPEITRAYNYIGLIQADEGKYEEALENIDKAIVGEPRVSKLYRSRAMVLAKMGRMKEAEEAEAEAKKIDEETP